MYHDIEYIAEYGVGVVMVLCATCGWSENVVGDVAGERAGRRHRLEHDTGVALVECGRCGDRVPVSQAPPLAAEGTYFQYVCLDCAESPLRRSALISDLLTLEQELR